MNVATAGETGLEFEPEVGDAGPETPSQALLLPCDVATGATTGDRVEVATGATGATGVDTTGADGAGRVSVTSGPVTVRNDPGGLICAKPAGLDSTGTTVCVMGAAPVG